MFFHRKFFGKTCSERDDVVRNLRHLLESKRGTGYFREQLGITETGYRTPEQMVASLSEEIRENIRLFEPRLEVVTIDERWDDAGRIRLEVTCRERSGGAPLHIIAASDSGRLSFDVGGTIDE